MARRLSTLVLVLSVVVGAPLLAGSRTRTGAHRAPRRAQTAAAADQLGGFWQRLTALWGAEGCAADPNGAKCAPAPAGGNAVAAQPPAPEGCGIDPDGCR